MSVVKFNQGETLGQFPTIFDEFFGGKLLERVSPRFSVPAVNVKETDDKFKVFLAAPGLNKEDFSISVDNDVLTISANKSVEKTEESERFTRKEYAYGSFSRSFNLSENIDVDGISATYKNGELTLEIPKKVEVKQELKKISIQ